MHSQTLSLSHIIFQQYCEKNCVLRGLPVSAAEKDNFLVQGPVELNSNISDLQSCAMVAVSSGNQLISWKDVTCVVFHADCSGSVDF